MQKILRKLLAIWKVQTEPVQRIIQVSTSTNCCHHCTLNVIGSETDFTQSFIHVLQQSNQATLPH